MYNPFTIKIAMNLWIDVGLCNGATGTVEDFIYANNQQPPDLPVVDILLAPAMIKLSAMSSCALDLIKSLFDKKLAGFFKQHVSDKGIINSKAPRKNTNPGKSYFNEAGYMELKIKAPIKLHKVSNDAIAENKAPCSFSPTLLDIIPRKMGETAPENMPAIGDKNTSHSFLANPNTNNADAREMIPILAMLTSLKHFPNSFIPRTAPMPLVR